MEHPKDIGDRTTLAVMLALRAAGFTVSVPFGENTRYDLVVDDGWSLGRVQCKSGQLVSGVVRFKTASTYAHHRSATQLRRDYKGEIEFFGVYCHANDRVYLVPIADVAATCEARLRVDPPRNGQMRRIRYASAYEIGVVRVRACYASTSRVFWCARIFRLTRWSALSIVFVSTSRSSAISS